MPFDPLAPTETERSNAYKGIWIGALCAIVTLPLFLMGFDGVAAAIPFGGNVGVLLASTITGRTDDYFRSLCATGHRWVVFALSIYMLAAWLAQIADLSHAAGSALSTGSFNGSTSVPIALIFDAYLFAIILSLIFYAGYGFAWLRDHFTTSGEE